MATELLGSDSILFPCTVSGVHHTLLPELRREYRRFVALVSIATGLEIYTDTSGASLV